MKNKKKSFNKLKLLIFVVGMLWFPLSVLADSCGTLNTDKTLTSNITTTGTCFIINASNIILDGAGYTIIGNSSDYGIDLSGLDNVTIRNFGEISNFGAGVFAESTDNSTIINNTIIINSTMGSGITLLNAAYSNISLNTVNISGDSGSAIGLSKNTNNNIFTQNTIYSTDITSGIILFETPVYNNFTNNQIHCSGSDSFCLDIEENAANNNFINGFLNGTDGAIEVDILALTGENNNLINVSFNKSSILFEDNPNTGGITVKWYVDVNVIDSGSSPLENANVLGYNIYDSLEQSLLTNSNGLARLTLTEFYWKNDTTAINYSTPHSINVSLTGYNDNSTTVNLTETNSTTVGITLTSAGGGAVPEFSDYAILLILITVVGGFFVMKRKDGYK
ncbi:MAG: NosD domain-containing protein [Candidatus Woesearchaeota archaeon]